MRIIQFIPTIAYGDAVGNDAVALRKVIEEMGYETGIYAESVVPPLGRKTAMLINELPELNEKDVGILHLSTGAQLNYDFAKFPCKKVVIYHNVTPPCYFSDSDSYIEGINQWALEAVKYLADKVDYCIADSEYNKEELVKMGYQCPIDVLSVLIPFDDYRKKPNASVLKHYSDGNTNIVFTGRIVPNKKQEDIIAAFYYYKKYYDPTARLFIVGAYKEENRYYRRLKKYVEQLELQDVVFTGHIGFDEILAYYKIASVFLCMSEHEGFCVPLVEAMFFQVPIVAYNSSAIPYTLGHSGFLIDTQNPLEVAGIMNYIVKNNEVQQQLIEGQSIRLGDFAYEQIKDRFEELLKEFLRGEKNEKDSIN